MTDGAHMADFWDARAREDALFFVDSRLTYGAADEVRFWDQGVRDLDSVLGMLGVAVDPEQTVLDLGCGVGRFTRVLAHRAHHVHALDVSGEMLDRARANLAEAGNVSFHHGDGVTLGSLPDASVDACISFVVFQHIPDPQITLGYVREIGRVLRPGGWAAFQVSGDPGLHRPRRRRFGLRRSGPAGQADPAWLGSSVTLEQLEGAAGDGGMALERVQGERTQYCVVLARRRAA